MESVQQQKYQEIMNRYDELYSLELFGETIDGHKQVNPYVQQEVTSTFTKIEKSSLKHTQSKDLKI